MAAVILIVAGALALLSVMVLIVVILVAFSGFRVSGKEINCVIMEITAKEEEEEDNEN